MTWGETSPYMLSTCTKLTFIYFSFTYTIVLEPKHLQIMPLCYKANIKVLDPPVLFKVDYDDVDGRQERQIVLYLSF